MLQNHSNVLKKYTKIWIEVENLNGKDFDTKPICNNNYSKTKIQTYFHDNELAPGISSI